MVVVCMLPLRCDTTRTLSIGVVVVGGCALLLVNSFAIRGEEQLSSLLEKQGAGGRNIVVAEDGTNSWTTNAVEGRTEWYLELVGDKNESAAKLGAVIDDLLLRPPSHQ